MTISIYFHLFFIEPIFRIDQIHHQAFLVLCENLKFSLQEKPDDKSDRLEILLNKKIRKYIVIVIQIRSTTQNKICKNCYLFFAFEFDPILMLFI